MWGFDTLKDVLDVVVVPLVIFGLGIWLPRQLELQKRRAFINLIRRELGEMAPDPIIPESTGQWPKHLKKRFLHEAIFSKPSENRDFILSLPPDLAYNVAQLWIHFEKASTTKQDTDLAEHGDRWCDYLHGICEFFRKRGDQTLYSQIYEPWKKLTQAYRTSKQMPL